MPQCRVPVAREAATCLCPNAALQVHVKRPRVVLSRKEDQQAAAAASRIQGLEAILRRSNPLREQIISFSAAFHWGKHRPKNLPFWYSTGYLIWQAGYPLHPYFLCQILYVSGSKGSIAGSSCLFSRSLNLNWSTGILLHTSWEGDFHVAYLVFVFNVTKNTVNVTIKLYQALNFFFIQEADKI